MSEASDRILQELDELVNLVPAVSVEDGGKKFLEEFELDDLPDPTWLIEDYLVQDSLAMLVGAPGCGKTFLALDWAFTVASKLGRWHGHTACSDQTVLYVVGEGITGIKRRRAAWRSSRSYHEPLPITFRRGGLNVVNQVGDDWSTMLAWCKDHRPAFVVLDTLARCTLGSDENSSRDMGQFVAAADALRIASGGGTILTIHHTNKAGSTFRGSSALSGAMDTMVQVEAGGGGGKVKVIKMKDSDPPVPMEFSLRKVMGTGSCVIQPLR